MKKIIITSSGLTALIFLIVCIVLSAIVSNWYIEWREDVNENKQIIQQEEAVVLKDVSNRTGKEFETWLELREYVFCNLLRKGMTREEVEKAISTIGEYRLPMENEVSYKNKYLNKYLSPIVLYFSQYDGLVQWSGCFPEKHTCYLEASCEKR